LSDGTSLPNTQLRTQSQIHARTGRREEVAKGRRLRQAGASEPPIKALVPLTACMAAERQAVREGMGQALFNGVGF